MEQQEEKHIKTKVVLPKAKNFVRKALFGGTTLLPQISDRLRQAVLSEETLPKPLCEQKPGWSDLLRPRLKVKHRKGVGGVHVSAADVKPGFRPQYERRTT